MSSVVLKDLDELAGIMEKAGGKFVPAAKQALYEGAEVIANQVRANLDGAIMSDEDHRKHQTGALKRSLYTGKMNQRGNETVYTRIGFFGYDENGVPNPLKANILESGRSWHTIEGKKFFSKAVNATRGKARKAIAAKMEEYWKKVLGDK